MEKHKRVFGDKFYLSFSKPAWESCIIPVIEEVSTYCSCTDETPGETARIFHAANRPKSGEKRRFLDRNWLNFSLVRRAHACFGIPFAIWPHHRGLAFQRLRASTLPLDAHPRRPRWSGTHEKSDSYSVCFGDLMPGGDCRW